MRYYYSLLILPLVLAFTLVSNTNGSDLIKPVGATDVGAITNPLSTHAISYIQISDTIIPQIPATDLIPAHLATYSHTITEKDFYKKITESLVIYPKALGSNIVYSLNLDGKTVDSTSNKTIGALIASNIKKTPMIVTAISDHINDSIMQEDSDRFTVDFTLVDVKIELGTDTSKIFEARSIAFSEFYPNIKYTIDGKDLKQDELLYPITPTCTDSINAGSHNWTYTTAIQGPYKITDINGTAFDNTPYKTTIKQATLVGTVKVSGPPLFKFGEYLDHRTYTLTDIQFEHLKSLPASFQMGPDTRPFKERIFGDMTGAYMQEVLNDGYNTDTELIANNFTNVSLISSFQVKGSEIVEIKKPYVRINFPCKVDPATAPVITITDSKNPDFYREYTDFPDGTHGIFVSQDGTGNGGTPQTPISYTIINLYLGSPTYFKNIETKGNDSVIHLYKLIGAFDSRLPSFYTQANLSIYGYDGVDTNIITTPLQINGGSPTASHPVASLPIKVVQVQTKNIQIDAMKKIIFRKSIFASDIGTPKNLELNYDNMEQKCFERCIIRNMNVNASDAVLFNSSVLFNTTGVPLSQSTRCVSNSTDWQFKDRAGNIISKGGRIATHEKGIEITNAVDSQNIIISKDNNHFYGAQFEGDESNFKLKDNSILLNRGDPIVPPPTP